MKDALGVVENLEGRRKGRLETAEKTNMDFYSFHQILDCLFSQIKDLFQIFTPIGQAANQTDILSCAEVKATTSTTL